jgi:Ca2+-binding RTX toxin-like protein/type III secretion system FlhB-like substrate exporter
MASITRIGTEILVNTATASSQQNPNITALSGGGFVVTWDDLSQGVGGATGDTSNFAAKAQVFTAGGTPVGSEILVNTATTSFQGHTQITALSNGGFVVTWEDLSQGVGGTTGDSSGLAVKAQVYSAGGAPVGSEILVNTATLNPQGDPHITTLSNGGFVVSWTDLSAGVGGATGDADVHAVKAQAFAADGTTVGSEFLVNTATANMQLHAQITSLSGGGFVATWEDNSQGVGGATGDFSGTAVKAQVFGAGGSPVGGEVLVNTATLSDQFRPQITALSNGGFVVTWEDDSQGFGGATGDTTGSAIKMKVFAAGGAAVSSEILVNTATAGAQQVPQITALSGGGFVVTWQDDSLGVGGATGDTSQTAVKAQIFTAAGVPVGSEILVNTATLNTQDAPRITALSGGGFVVTWEDFSQGTGGATGDTSGTAIKAQAFAADGTPVGSEVLVNTATDSQQNNPHITGLSNGGFAVAWFDGSQGVGGATGDTDGSAIKAQVFSLATDTAPTVTASGGTTAATEQIAVAIDAGVTVADVDSTTLASATVSITGGFHNGEDVLGFTNAGATMGNIAGNYAAGTGILTLTSAGATATLAQWQAALHAVTYTDTSDAPNTASRTISFVVNDGTLASAASDKTVSVAAVNDPPVLSGMDATPSYNENAAPLVLDNTLVLADPDAPAVGSDIGSATVTITGGFLAGDVLNADVTGTAISASYLNGVLTLSGADTLADYQHVLTTVTFASSSDNPTNFGTDSARGIQWVVTDLGGASSVPQALALSINASNDAPTVAASAGTTTATEQIAVAVDAGVTVADVDNTTLASATVSITGNFHSGEDVLAFTNNGSTMGNIAGSYAAGTGILTLTSAGASATLAQWQAALHAVTYTDTSDAPNTANRTISFTVNDGTAASLASTKTVSVAAVDDPPVAHNDAFTTPETTALAGGSLFADNGSGADSDPDGGPAFSVISVNGNAGNVGSQITLGSGAHLTINTNGTFSYDPNHVFDYLAAGDSGASNTPATEQFTYAITGGSTATVTVTISGVDSDDILQGTAGPDALFGGIGNDTLNGLGGDDMLVGGAGADALVGGPGSDAASYTSSSAGVTVNLATGAASGGDAQGDTFSGIENLTGSVQADVLTGDSGNNVLNGGPGADTMTGGIGNDTYLVDNPGDAVIENANEGTDTVDAFIHYGLPANVENLVLQGSADLQGYGNTLVNTLTGNSGNNLLDGGGAADLMIGGDGNDTYFVDNIGDAITENANQGNDTVFATVNYGLSANVENLILQGGADLQGFGNGLANVIYGNSGNNLIDGGGGIDLMVGGVGNDTYFVDDTSDATFENPGEGNDAVFSTAHYGLAAEVETLVLQGTADLQGYGNNQANVIYGNSGNNLLNGAGGVDLMVGGIGNDTYFVDDTSDATFENPGEGNDTVFSTAHYGLAADVETLVLQGGADLQGYGNNQANTLYGNTGNNLLNGAGGADTMLGGIGNDTYFVDNVGDVVFENPGEGTDAVFSTISYTLSANVEALVLQGAGNLSGTGNALANSIFGNAGDNALDGGANADVLTGNAGNDTFVFHMGQAGGDTVVDFAGNGTAPGDSLQFVGYGAGATFTQNDATHWQVNYNGGGSHEVITFMNGASIHPSDVVLM